MKILVTGAAGFIGSALVKRLLKEGNLVIGVDNLNDYYNPKLKLSRLKQIEEKAPQNSWSFHKLNLEDGKAINQLFSIKKPSIVVNLAAQAGVRYSLENPSVYVQANLVGFSHILEGCRNHGIKHLVYASSSSVYGVSSEKNV